MPSYRVSAENAYQGHTPGTVFESKETDAIKRAVARGSITRVEKTPKAPSRKSR